MEAAKAEDLKQPSLSFTIDRLLFNKGEPSQKVPELKGLHEEAGETMGEAEDPKPKLSYIALISNAILSSPAKKLLLSDIYQWMMDNYPYFKHKGRNWRNSVRHNLSLHECFIKAGPSSNGRGHFWAIHPTSLEGFTKGNFHRQGARRGIRRRAVNRGAHQPDAASRDGFSCSFPGQGCLSGPAASSRSLLPCPSQPCWPAGSLLLLPPTVPGLHPFLPGGGPQKSHASKLLGWAGQHCFCPALMATSWPACDPKVIPTQPLGCLLSRSPPSA